MTMPDEGPERVVRLLRRDMFGTLGGDGGFTGAEDLDRDGAALGGDAAVAGVGDADPDDLGDGAAYVAEVQGYVQLVVPGWPACPRHREHSLRFRDGAWWCERGAVALAPLGELCAVVPPVDDGGPPGAVPSASPQSLFTRA